MKNKKWAKIIEKEYPLLKTFLKKKRKWCEYLNNVEAYPLFTRDLIIGAFVFKKDYWWKIHFEWENLIQEL